MKEREQLARENERLQLAINELKVLNDIATAISSMDSVDDIIDQIVMKCIKHLGVEEGTVSLLEREQEEDQFHTMVRRMDVTTDKVPIKMDSRLKGWMLKNRSMLMSNNIAEDGRFNYLKEEELNFTSILCAPLIMKGTLIGYLAVFNKKDGSPFTDEDRRVLSIIGSQSAQVIENARLHEEEKALISLQEELKMARDIQLRLLPEKVPDIPGYQVSAINKPAKSVGGDYYDFLTHEDGKTGFCLGDITGKGMPAAMLMSNLQATIRSQAAIFEDCSKCMEGTNKLLFKSTEPSKFATVFYGILEWEKGLLEYTNGGHDEPLLFKSGKDPIKLKSTGLLAGVVEDTSYGKETVRLEEKDLLLVYTDGITEAMNSKKEEFGLERLVKTVQENREKTTDQLVETILENIKRHAGEAIQSDDITLMIIKREEAS